MRLTKIKLSGFKSFVDPTTLIVPGNLTGVVGPNGCGKSNIIDAVTWVMGESSAKHLRGDALTDVIFNGSSTRNPVGQASVELVFDNTENKLGGQYASYDEISIKRQITRDAVSTYFLNGTRCRRRDIQAIFLGTGLGPRSYAIIEQGMISRLIEAKPEDLRSFIEEAAGISKYRERRRETENRIRNARENIARLNDIREELDKQLKHLQRQANAAERYQVLKQEERKLDAELQALNWRTLKQQSQRQEEETRQQETRVEAAVAELRQVENTIVQEREQLTTANEHFNNAQSEYYRIGGDISQLEQKIHHLQERIADTHEEIARVARELDTSREQSTQDEAKLAELATVRASLEPKLQGSRGESDKAYVLLNESEQAMQAWQSEWEAFNTSMAEYARRTEVGKTRLEHLELSIEDIEQRQNSLRRELDTITKAGLDASMGGVMKQLKTAESGLAKQQQALEQRHLQSQELRRTSQQLNEQLNQQHVLHQKQQGRLASLEALQQSAAGEDQAATRDWLKQSGLADRPRLAQKTKVEPRWAYAVEIVLERHLQGVYVDDLKPHLKTVQKLQHGHVSLIAAGGAADSTASGRYPSLASKVQGDFPLRHLLSSVYVAENLDAALELRTKLNGTETVITPDGNWLGVNWMQVFRKQGAESGILARENEIRTLKDELSKSSATLAGLESRAKSILQDLENHEQQLAELQTNVNRQQDDVSRLRAGLAAGQAQQEQAGLRKSRIEEELGDLQAQLDEHRTEMETLQAELKTLSGQQAEFEQQRVTLMTQRDVHRTSLTGARERWQNTHEHSHGIALQMEAISSQRAALEQSIKRSQLQITHLSARREELQKAQENNQPPLARMKQELEARLRDKVSAEKQLAEARAGVVKLENTLRERENSRTQQEKQILELRESLQQTRLNLQESRVRLQTIEESLAAAGQVLQELLTGLEEGAEVTAWKERLESVIQKIHRLGPINLAAIDEFSQLSERKTYLDRQDQDLREALTTLENAIHKIDKETKSRFRETFDQLNSNLQEMFPRLFGGGQAYLELTGDDLLETGVTIMARPPGKRNSTIHLLSGGEKALTAVAMVFSIFKLNPAPFCILDEVDAPLDDANVGRFSEMVASMSEDVQFIFITHNKITMEIAHQLLGVTMHEAGVSRLVSVDVDEAVKLAATA